MGVIGKLGLAAGVAALTVVGVAAVRTLTWAPPAVVEGAIDLADAPNFDVQAAAGRLSEAITFRTVSHQDAADNDLDQWSLFHAWLQATYPRAHGVMRREIVAGHTLVYSWAGTDPRLDPIVLMAHQDVVPADAAEGWTHPPFEGVIAEGAVWGRGAVDDKGSLIGLFEAVESLAAAGFKPRRTVMLISGHDEEVGGTGAQAANALMKSRNLSAQFVLDEGLLVVADNPLTGGPAALIGVAEKGYGTLIVTARAEGGHSSSPPPETSAGVLARAVTAISEDPFPMRLQGPGADMLAVLGADAGLPLRVALANTWATEPLIVRQMAATPAGAALLHTTIAPTMLEGADKENILPREARAWINYRIAPGDTSDEVMAKARAAVGDLPVELAWSRPPQEASKVSSTDSESWKTIAALAADVTGAPVTPGLVVAGTDSRFMAEVAQDTYRFQPITLSLADTAMIHGVDERMTLTNLERMIAFYARLIATAAR
ncbi:MAG: M20 family peptidase [Caulobacteraceae bacterium]|nr:M20 family peptidase [Caulobacteraceae bacterium]MDX5392598.1 M20 family peptidase [Caulobacteraceae bacterium]